jgi:hypothetical protein
MGPVHRCSSEIVCAYGMPYVVCVVLVCELLSVLRISLVLAKIEMKYSDSRGKANAGGIGRNFANEQAMVSHVDIGSHCSATRSPRSTLGMFAFEEPRKVEFFLVFCFSCGVVTPRERIIPFMAGYVLAGPCYRVV